MKFWADLAIQLSYPMIRDLLEISYLAIWWLKDGFPQCLINVKIHQGSLFSFTLNYCLESGDFSDIMMSIVQTHKAVSEALLNSALSKDIQDTHL